MVGASLLAKQGPTRAIKSCNNIVVDSYKIIIVLLHKECVCLLSGKGRPLQHNGAQLPLLSNKLTRGIKFANLVL